MTYCWPALVLEDIKDDLLEIQCSNSGIMLQFIHQLAFNIAIESWSKMIRILVISSHIGCNGDGERAPYLSVSLRDLRTELIQNSVLGVIHGAEPSSVVFFVRIISWRDAYDSMTVKFGMCEGIYQPYASRTQSGL